MPQYKHILTDFKDLRKIIGEVTKSKPAKTRYQQQAKKMNYRQHNEADAQGVDKNKAAQLKKKKDHAGEEEIKKAYMALGRSAQGSVEFQRKLIQKQLKKMGYNTYSKLAFDTIFNRPLTKEDLDTLFSLTEAFSAKQIKKLKSAYRGIDKIDPSSSSGKALLNKFSTMQKDELMDIAAAGISFLSLLAASQLISKFGMKAGSFTYQQAGESVNEYVVLDTGLEKALKKFKVKFSKDLKSIKEGGMKRLFTDLENGATAQQISKKYGIDIKTAKSFVDDYKKVSQAPRLRAAENDPLKEANLQEEMIQDFEIRFDKESDWKKAGKMVKDYLRTQAPKHAKALLTKTSVIGPDPMMVAVGDTNQKLKPPVNLNKLYNDIRKLRSSRMKYWMGIPKKDEPIAVGENIQEGTWAVPDSREKIEKLNNWLSQPRRIKVEKEADLVWNTISGIVGDDGVADEWNTMIGYGFHGKTSDAREPVVDWLKDWGFKLSGYKITHAPASYLEGVGESKEQTEGSFSQGWRKLKKKGRIKKPMKKPTKLESREDRLKEQKEHANQSPFKLKSEQVPRAIAINTDGFGHRHATVEDIISACDSFGMILDKELQVEQIQKQLGKKGFISFKQTDLEDVFEERETQRMILALESDVEEQRPIEYTKNEITEAFIMGEEIEFLKPDGLKTAGPVLKKGGNTYNVKDKFTGKSFTYKYSGKDVKLEEGKVKTFKEVTQNIQEITLGPNMLRKDFPNVWATKDSKLYRVLTVLIDLHGFTTNLSSYKKDKKDFLDSLRSIAKSDANMRKAGFNGGDIRYIKNPKKDQAFAEDIQEGKFSKQLIKQAGGIAFDKRYYMGNMSGAVRAIEKLKKGLSDDPKVKDMLRIANESSETTDYTNWLPEGGDKEAYKKFFNAALKKFGVSSPDELEGEKKKKFFDYVDKNWKGDHEEVEQDVHKTYKMDGRRKNFREKMKKLGYIKGT